MCRSGACQQAAEAQPALIPQQHPVTRLAAHRRRRASRASGAARAAWPSRWRRCRRCWQRWRSGVAGSRAAFICWASPRFGWGLLGVLAACCWIGGGSQIAAGPPPGSRVPPVHPVLCS
jgi:hypothetical protein